MGGGLYMVPIAGGAARRITSEISDAMPAWTHDDADLVFQRASPEGPRIWTVNVQTGAARALSPPGANAPATSPTEDRIAYVQAIPHGAQLVTTSLASSVPRVLDTGTFAGTGSVRFAPDGKRVAFIRNDVELVEVSLDGRTPLAVRWKASVEGIESFDYELDGKGFVVSVALWDGDVWIGDGDFP